MPFWHVWNSLILLHCQSFSPWGATVITYSLLAYIDIVSYLGQNLRYYDVCLFRAQYREASGASRDSHCASHSCGVKRNGHAKWRNVVKKVIFKNLSACFGASGGRSFRNMAVIGCAGAAWNASPNKGWAVIYTLIPSPCLKSEVYSYPWTGIEVGWICETSCHWQL